jgi:8-oxo-dGTP diphosphatase
MTTLIIPPTKVAGCVVKNDDDEILLLHRNTDKFVHWELPGGKVEDGEDPASAAVREFAEETGLVVEIVRKLGKGEFSQIQDDKSYEYDWFLAEVVGEPEPAVQEPQLHDDIGWFSLEAIDQLDSISKNMEVLRAAIARDEVVL